MSKQKYTECEKLSEVSEKSQIVGEFLDWLKEEKGYQLMEEGEPDKYDDCYHFPVLTRTEDLLAEFFKIDLKKVEKERQQMLSDLRKSNGD